MPRPRRIPWRCATGTTPRPRSPRRRPPRPAAGCAGTPGGRSPGRSAAPRPAGPTATGPGVTPTRCGRAPGRGGARRPRPPRRPRRGGPGRRPGSSPGAGSAPNPAAARRGSCPPAGRTPRPGPTRRGRSRCLDGAEVERGREHAEVAEQALLGRVEELVAPVDRRLHRGVPRRVARGATRQQREAVVEPPVELVEVEAPELPGGQLDGQRHVVEPAAQLDHHRIGGVPRASWARRRGPARRTGPAPPRGAGPAARRARRPRPAARGWWPGCCAVSPRASIRSTNRSRTVEHVLAVVEHQQDRPVGQVVGQSIDRLGRAALHTSGFGDGTGHVTAGRHRREVDEHGAVGVVGLQPLGDRQREGRLADASRAR